MIARTISRSLRVQANVQPKACWWNALDVGEILASEGRSVRYVEGWVVTMISGTMPFFMEHGWLEVDGVTTEPTLEDACRAYFPALSLNIDEALRTSTSRDLMPFSVFHDELRDPAAWGGAMILAMANAFGQTPEKAAKWMAENGCKVPPIPAVKQAGATA